MRGIFSTTLAQFGAAALGRYRALVDTGLGDLLEDPNCPGSAARDELGPSVRSYHLQYCRRRARIGGRSVARPRHVLIYRVTEDEIVVVRVLHDAMELSRHIPPPE